MFGNRWFGLNPKPVVKIQYMTPRVKAALGLLAVLVFGFACFVSGNVYELEHRIITQRIELPTIDTLEDDGSDFDQQFMPAVEPVEEELSEYIVKVRMRVVAQPQLWDPESEEVLAEEQYCLAQNIYFEARSESRKGMIAVGLVTLNRVRARRFPNSICGVVWQKARNQNERWVAQFSWTWDGKGDTPREMERWEEAQMIAGAMIAERSLDNFSDFTNGSTHYHAEYVDPWWGREFVAAGYTVQQIDTHLFYAIY